LRCTHQFSKVRVLMPRASTRADLLMKFSI
jgi:hypothetical protein